jgi:hypothetical protein
MDQETSVGIVHNLPHDLTLTSVVLHRENQTVSHGSWKIETGNYNPFELVDGGLSLSNAEHAYPEAFGGIADFLSTRCGASTRILIEYPDGQVSATSAFSQLVAFLIKQGFGSCIIDFDDHSTVVHFREIPADQKPAAMKDDLIFLGSGKAKAYAMFLFNAESFTGSQHALAAALIAMNPHLHYYLKSPGVVFSSQDIALFLKKPDFFNPLVMSGQTIYILSKTPLCVAHDLEELHLEFELARKRFNFLPSGEALKFAVLQVCKQTGLRLHCLPVQNPLADRLLDEEPIGPDECVAYDPSRTDPAWVGTAE